MAECHVDPLTGFDQFRLAYTQLVEENKRLKEQLERTQHESYELQRNCKDARKQPSDHEHVSNSKKKPVSERDTFYRQTATYGSLSRSELEQVAASLSKDRLMLESRYADRSAKLLRTAQEYENLRQKYNRLLKAYEKNSGKMTSLKAIYRRQREELHTMKAQMSAQLNNHAELMQLTRSKRRRSSTGGMDLSQNRTVSGQVQSNSARQENCDKTNDTPPSPSNIRAQRSCSDLIISPRKIKSADLAKSSPVCHKEGISVNSDEATHEPATSEAAPPINSNEELSQTFPYLMKDLAHSQSPSRRSHDGSSQASGAGPSPTRSVSEPMTGSPLAVMRGRGMGDPASLWPSMIHEPTIGTESHHDQLSYDSETEEFNIISHDRHEPRSDGTTIDLSSYAFHAVNQEEREHTSIPKRRASLSNTNPQMAAKCISAAESPSKRRKVEETEMARFDEPNNPFLLDAPPSPVLGRPYISQAERRMPSMEPSISRDETVVIDPPSPQQQPADLVFDDEGIILPPPIPQVYKSPSERVRSNVKPAKIERKTATDSSRGAMKDKNNELNQMHDDNEWQKSRGLAAKDGLARQGDMVYKFNEVVRNKQDRKRMHGTDCACCKKYYEITGDLPIPDGGQGPTFRGSAPNRTTISASERMQQISRHRHWHEPPQTPPGYWKVGFPDTQEIQEWNAIAVARKEAKQHN